MILKLAKASYLLVEKGEECDGGKVEDTVGGRAPYCRRHRNQVVHTETLRYGNKHTNDNV